MDEATPATQHAEERGFFTNLLDVYLAPGEAFGHITRKPRFWAPLLCFLTVNVAFTGVWMTSVDARGFMEAQLKESPRTADLPAEQREQIVSQQASMFPIFAWLGALVFSPLFLALSAGLYLFIFRFFYAGELGFKTSLTLTAWTFLAVSLVQSPLILLVLHLKDDWALNPQTALQTNLSILLERGDAAPALWTLFSSLDLMTFWTLFLLAVGYGAAVRKPPVSTIWGVAAPWLVYVVSRVGWAALTG